MNEAIRMSSDQSSPLGSSNVVPFPLAKKRPLREAWEKYRECSRESMHSRLGSIWKHQLALLHELDILELTANQLAIWEAKQISALYAPKTTYDAWTQLAACVRMSLGEDEELPWRMSRGRYWRPRRSPRPLKNVPACGTVKEAELLIHAALCVDLAHRQGFHGEAYAHRLHDLGPRCAVGLLMGLRNGELAGLGWDDLLLDGERPMARVRHQAIDQWRRYHPTWRRPVTPPKGGRERRLLLHPTVLVACKQQRALLDERGWYREDGPIFPAPESSRFEGTWRNNANAIKPELMKVLAKAAGLPFPDEWVTHSLRHSLATLENVSGADLRTIQKRTGHSSLRILEDYIHAKTGRALAPSAIPELELKFDDELVLGTTDTSDEHDTDPAPPPNGDE